MPDSTPTSLIRRHAGPLIVWVLLAVLVTAYVVINTSWIRANGNYIQFDVVAHLDEMADYYGLTNAIGEHVGGPFRKLYHLAALLNNQAATHPMWPRLVYAISTLWCLTLGGGERAPFYSNFVFVALAIAGGMLLMRQVLRGRGSDDDTAAWEGGLYAVLLALLLPGFYGPLRLYSQYFPLACCLPLCLALLMGSDGFLHRRMAMAFGVAAGVTILVKSLLPFFLVFPGVLLGIWLVRHLWKAPTENPAENRLAPLLNFALAMIPVALLSYLWLHGHLFVVLQEIVAHVAPETIPFPDGQASPHYEEYPAYSWLWLTYYVRVAISNLGPMGCSALGLSVLLLVACRKLLDPQLRGNRWLLYLTAMGAPLVLTFISSKEARFLIPMYPIWAAVMAQGLMVLRPWPRRGIVAVLVIIGSVTMMRISFDDEASWRTREFLYERMGNEEGDIWAFTARPARFEGLAEQVARALDERTEGPVQVGFLTLPHGGPGFDRHQDLVRLEAYRLKFQIPAISRTWNDFFPLDAMEHLGSIETIDMRFFQPDYFDKDATSLDLLVVAHFFESYEGYNPPYNTHWGGPMPDIVYARTLEELQAGLPESFEQISVHDYTGPQYRDQARAALFYQPQPASQ